ncbi:hypothetical protein [Stieleria varia]|uniref:Tetratricopeptide repeat protein n=1 Tax=Stieleria varia TaxID=2528005 RepID=A0A5C6ASR8_9BACT|nr:hypothetical protein [Stieleria varia]TWU02578.1 hypothetical protein Pla52n_36280 [Stieleria varia]
MHSVIRGLIPLLVVGMLSIANSAVAGISSENIIVVVNGSSQVSRTIANHYVQLRNIPSSNVVVLSDVPSGLLVEYEPFRDKILKPLLTQIDSRGLASHTRVIAYSADFPTMVGIKSFTDQIKEPTIKKYQLPVASINGATYLYRFLLDNNPAFLSLGANFYARGDFERTFTNPYLDDRRSAFEDAEKLRLDGRYADAAERYQELFAKTPYTAALAIRSAECFQHAEQSDKAVELLTAAIKSGWSSRRYLQESVVLSELLDRDGLSAMVTALDDLPIASQGPVGFRGDLGWALNGSYMPVKQGGIPYLMSCCLAVVHPRGSTVDQAVAVLQRAATADRTFPQARFAFSGHPGVRSKTRKPGMANALVALQEMGHQTEVFSGDQPAEGGAIVGLMTGRPTIQFRSMPWKLVPGSIAENLTSLGGAYNLDGHTKLTEFLHAGAAMSSGAVAEPYALQQKFPLPMMYAFYAKGVSAIEAFYLSVASPYQLLIVGDPMTQPFSRAPAELIDMQLATEGQTMIELQRRALGLTLPKTNTVAINILVEGRMAQTSPAVPKIRINLPADASGVLEIRATLIGADPTMPQVGFIEEIELQGPHPSPSAMAADAPKDDPTKDPTEKIAANEGQQIKLSLTCPGADSIRLMHFGSEVARLDDSQGTVTVDASALGSGPLRFTPFAHFGKTIVRGKQLVVQR